MKFSLPATFFLLLAALAALALSLHAPYVPQHLHAAPQKVSTVALQQQEAYGFQHVDGAVQGIAVQEEADAKFGVSLADTGCAPSASCWAVLNRPALHPSTATSRYVPPVSEQLPANLAATPPDQPPRFPL